jgi:hypothetical protein
MDDSSVFTGRKAETMGTHISELVDVLMANKEILYLLFPM